MTHRNPIPSLSLSVIAPLGVLLLVSVTASAASVDLAKTGQTYCYSQAGAVIDCAGTGQDGEYQKGIAWPDPRFTNNGDGTITDNLTGLTWVQDTACIAQAHWPDALVSVNALSDGTCDLTDGSTAGDWRMANFLELVSLANLSLGELASFGFTNLSAAGFYSSTSRMDPTTVFGYQFSARFSGSYLKTGNYKTWPVKGVSTGPAKVWKTGQTTCYAYPTGYVIDCAGTGQDGDLQAGAPWPLTRFTDNGDGTVTDHLTGLVWLKDTDCFGPHIWSEALSNANGLADGACGLTDGSSTGDWRLPNWVEITSLVDFSQAGLMLTPGHPFVSYPSALHWTSSNYPPYPVYAYVAGPTSSTGIVYLTKTYEGDIWPVRDGVAVDTCNTNTVASVVESGAAFYEACDQLTVGPDFLAEETADVVLSAGQQINFIPEFMVMKGATLDADVCGQSLCAPSAEPMPDGCHSCVAAVCLSDSSCCNIAWNQSCVDLVNTECGLVCE